MVRSDKVSPKKYQIIGGRKYYFKRSDAERARKYNERIYETKGLGFYIVRPSNNGFSL